MLHNKKGLSGLQTKLLIGFWWKVSLLTGYKGWRMSNNIISFPVRDVIAIKWLVALLFQAILIKGSSCSWIIVLSFKFQVSKNLAVLSAPTVTKALPSGQKLTSKTSLSWVITNLDRLWASISHKEHVVSIELQQI